MPKNSPAPLHYKGKDAIQHVAETQAQGKLTAAEIHGAEPPGHIVSGSDSARETAVMLLLAGLVISRISESPIQGLNLFLSISLGWLLWKTGRSAWLGWQRLERLHRIVAEEKWEIEHHREQEREELVALYSAKGFHGKLLNDVVDVFMSDEDRLLRVMIDEELNLSLESEEHPLKQALGAFLGTLTATIFCSLSFLFFGRIGLFISGLFVLGIAGAVSATYQKNRRSPAIIWNIGLGILSYGFAFFFLELIE